MKSSNSMILKALILMIVFTLLCGVAYPLAMTGISQLLFKDKSNGSIIEVEGVKYGSVLLAQEFTGNEFLWGRVMNVDTETLIGDDGKPLMYAGPSNLSPASDEYEALIAERVMKIRAAHPDQKDTPIPVDLVTCSGSGLDPHISPAAAEYQIDRIASARGIAASEVKHIIDQYTTGRFLGVFGEKTVNVLQVNLSLEGILK